MKEKTRILLSRPKYRLMSVERAAERVEADYVALLAWLLENTAVSAGLWSRWKKGTKEVGADHLVEFLKELHDDTPPGARASEM